MGIRSGVRRAIARINVAGVIETDDGGQIGIAGRGVLRQSDVGVGGIALRRHVKAGGERAGLTGTK